MTRDLSELIAETEGLQPWRRVFHASNGIVLALGPGALGLSPMQAAALLGLASGLLLFVDLARLRWPAANLLFFRAFRKLASPREAEGIASSTWYAIGACLAWWWFPPPIAVASILVLGLADPSASVFGRLYGRRRLGKGTVEGALTFAGVGVLVLWPQVGLGAAVTAAAVTALAEIMPGPVDDNLVIPVVCGALLWTLVPV